MSKTLGPIHYWLYNKINIQNNIVEDIIKTFNIDEHLVNKLYEDYGDGDLKPLEEVIDTTHIHGWLQEQITKVENKLAFVVTQVLSEDEKAINKLKEIFRANGQKYSKLNKQSNIEEIFKQINDTILDGMPCDRVNAIVSNDENEVVWKRYECVHKKYWDSFNGDVSIYYLLRDELLSGLVSKADATYEKIDDTTSRVKRS